MLILPIRFLLIIKADRYSRERIVRIKNPRQGSQEESMDYLEFIARVTSHIPDKGQVTFGGGTDFPLPTVAMDFRLRFLPPLLGQGLCPVLRPKGHTPLESPDCFV